MKNSYIPSRGDLIWIDFDPQAGKEQSGRRPALVISPVDYNKKVGLALICPITNQQKGYPFEVILPLSLKITGVILSDHIKSLDWKIRNAEYKDKLPESIMEEILSKIITLIE